MSLPALDWAGGAAGAALALAAAAAFFLHSRRSPVGPFLLLLR